MQAHSPKLNHPHGSGKKAKRSLSHEHMRTHSKESKDQPDLSGARSGREPKHLPHPIDIASNHHGKFAEAHPNFQDGKGTFFSRDGLRLSKEKQRSHDAPCSPKTKESYMHLADSTRSPRHKEPYIHNSNGPHSPRSPMSPKSPKSPKIKDSHFNYWPISPKNESYIHHAEVPKSPKSKETGRHPSHGHHSPKTKDMHRLQDPGSPKHKGKETHHQISSSPNKESRFQRTNSAEKPTPGKSCEMDKPHDPLTPVHSGSPPVIRSKDSNGHIQLREAYAHRRRTGAMSHPNLHHKHFNGCKSKSDEPPSPELPAKTSRRRAASSEDTTSIGSKSPDLTPLVLGGKHGSDSVEFKRQTSLEMSPISPQGFFHSEESLDSAGQSSPELPARTRRKKYDKLSIAHQSPELPIRMNGKEKNCDVFESPKKQVPIANHEFEAKDVSHNDTRGKSKNVSSPVKNSGKSSDGSQKGQEMDGWSSFGLQKKNEQIAAMSEVGTQKKNDKMNCDSVVEEIKPKVVDQSTTMSTPIIVTDDESEPPTGNRATSGEQNQKELLDMIDNDRRTKLHPGHLDDRYLGGGMVGGHLGVYRSASMPGYTNSSRQLVSRATSMTSGGSLRSGLARSSMTRRTVRQKQTKSWTGCGDGSLGCSDNWRFCPVHKVCNSVVDVAVMQEAHGLIMDMLADSTLPPNVVSGLKAVSSLLSPPTNYNTLQRPKISPLVALSESMYTSDIDDSPYVGERPLSLPKRLRRSLPPSLIRRMSTTWTTTTSATGMPTLEPQPLRTRSSSFRHSRDLTSSPSPGNSRSSSPAPLLRQGGGDGSLKSRSFSVGTGGLGQRSPSPNLMPPDGKGLRSSSLRGSLGGSSVPTLLKTENGQSPRLDDTMMAAEESDDDTSRLEELSNQPITLTITPDEAAKDASENVEDTETTAAPTDNNNTNNIEKSDELASHGSSLKPRGSGKKRGSVTISEHATIIEEGMARTIPTEDVAITEATEEQDDELAADEAIEELDPTHEECRELLGRLDEWDFPIFQISELSDNQVLSQVAYRLFTDAGIFETFRISLPEFMNYFRALECGYRHKPYHNRIHAADVLHGCYYMSTQQIPGFTQVNPEDLDPMGRQDDDPDSFHTPTVTPRASISSDSSYGILAGNLPALELMALYTAAAMHDYDHPGRTNAFLVATSASQAILYNDRSVLENHHAAASWSLFLSKPEFNFLSSLDVAEFKRFRFLVVEFILATDLKRHFDFLVEFNAKVNDVDAPGINWAVEADRLLVCQMCIKLADISGPTKIKDLHCNWTYRISEEFYEQGDDERQLGLPVSPYMDRNAPQLAKLQEGFINHLVAPLCNAYGSAGLLPGRWLDEEDDDHSAKSETKVESERGDFSDKDNDDDDVDDDDDNDEESNDGDTKLRLKSAGQQKTRKMVSILTKHLKENHEMWLKVLKEEEAEKRRTENPDGLPPSPTSKDKEDGMNLSAIHTPNHEIIRQVFVPRGQDTSPKVESDDLVFVDEEEEESMKSMAPIREDSEERNSDCSRSMEGDNGLTDQELSEDCCHDNKPQEGSRLGDNQKAAEET
ncbi:uncharacterized protein LOC129283067 [Lytechinus pictus]|uniref:uncharacterized protein LOC129283067 n=1 Tax=Lytechinus pictus TaxID=7653 RepID=UPI0030B9C9FC